MLFPKWVPKVNQIIRFEIISVEEHLFTECTIIARTKVVRKGVAEFIMCTSLGDVIYNDGENWFWIDRSQLESDEEEYSAVSIKSIVLL